MNKFKVGDRVVGNEKASCAYGITKKGYIGMVSRIVSEYMIKFESGFYVDSECFDLVESADRHELHVTSDGTTTNAVYKLNGKVEKTAKSVCCPSDTFNFNVGAELAINRVLYGTDYNPKDVAFKAEKVEPVYYSGKVVCVAWCGNLYTIGKVYEVVNGIMKNNNGGKSVLLHSFDEVGNYCHGKFIEYRGEQS